jgi:PTH1 family peptidyl-tRNA hydrolase
MQEALRRAISSQGFFLSMPLEFIIAGLGNPGPRYDRTRHNLGFRVADALAAARRGKWGDTVRRMRSASIRLRDAHGLIVEPLTYMNLSGDALAPLMLSEQLPPSRLLVVCDDIALPLGQIRVRASGSDGGHNGLKSIIERLNTLDFPRLRMGCGPVPPRVDAAEFVLAEFLPEEEAAVEAMIKESVACCESWAYDGIGRAMSKFNAKKEPPVAE